MIYHFNDFTFDNVNKILSYAQEKIPLTKQQYELLTLFLNKPNTIISYDELISTIWAGKEVSDNTVTKSITRLNKILEEKSHTRLFDNKYAQGFIFLQPVTIVESNDGNLFTTEKKNKSIFNNPLVHVLLVLLLMVSIYYSHQHYNDVQLEKPVILVMPELGLSNQYANTQGLILQQFLALSNNVLFKGIQDKPKNLDDTVFIGKQRALSNNLQVLTTKLIENKDSTTIKFSLTNENNIKSTQSFTDKTFRLVFVEANKWLQEELKLEKTSHFSTKLLPRNSHLLNLYIKGLSSFTTGDFNKASQLFTLCLSEDSDFHLARLQLAKVKYKQGENLESLAMIDTILQLIDNPELIIETQILRSEILYYNKDIDLAKTILLDLLKKYEGEIRPSLDVVRFQLIWIYFFTETKYKTLEEISKLEKNLATNANPELLAKTLIKKATILLNIGQQNKSSIATNKALQIFTKSGNVAKIAHAEFLLARIYTQQARYDKALFLLNKGLKVFKEKNDLHAIAGTLFRIVKVHITQGQFNLALQLNQESESYASKKGHKGLLRKAKENAIIIAIKQSRWQLAELLIDEYFSHAENYESRVRYIYNQFFKIDLLLEQKISNGVIELINQTREYFKKPPSRRIAQILNFKQAQLFQLTKQYNDAIAVLESEWTKVENSNDNESKIFINNLLAQIYIDSRDTKRAVKILDRNKPLEPFAYPYLLLKAKALLLQNKKKQAIETLQNCQSNAHELWTIEDQKFLSLLKN